MAVHDKCFAREEFLDLELLPASLNSSDIYNALVSVVESMIDFTNVPA